MNGLGRGNSYFAKTRLAMLACVLGLGLAALWPGAARAANLPQPQINSLADEGGGNIRASWQLAESVNLSDAFPMKEVCARTYKLPLDLTKTSLDGADAHTCFSDNLANGQAGQADLVFPSGIENYPDITEATFEVNLVLEYSGPHGSYYRLSGYSTVEVRQP